MLIDAHVHMWNRKTLPDQAILSYLAPILDFQDKFGHLFDLGMEGDMPFPDYEVPVDTIIEIMDLNRMDGMVVLATDFELVGGHRMGLEEHMEWLFQRCSVDDRFHPFIGVDPNRPNAPELVEQLVKKYSPIGIKMYPAVGFYPDEERMDAYWKMVDDLGLLVVTHTGMALEPLDEKYCHPNMMRKVADRYPDTNFIIAHLGGKFHDELFPLMEACDNVYADCSALQGWVPEDIGMLHKRIDDAMSLFPDRIVFGSDFPLYEEMFSMRRFIEEIDKREWESEKIRNDFFGDTMARLMDLK